MYEWVMLLGMASIIIFCFYLSSQIDEICSKITFTFALFARQEEKGKPGEWVPINEYGEIAKGDMKRRKIKPKRKLKKENDSGNGNK